jgi:hypothetical protein
VMNRSDHLLGVMLKGRMITNDEYLTALVEIPFSEEPSYLVDIEQDPNYVEEIIPASKDEFKTDEEQVPAATEESGEAKEQFTTQDGIVEIPIQGN